MSWCRARCAGERRLPQRRCGGVASLQLWRRGATWPPLHARVCAVDNRTGRVPQDSMIRPRPRPAGRVEGTAGNGGGERLTQHLTGPRSCRCGTLKRRRRGSRGKRVVRHSAQQVAQAILGPRQRAPVLQQRVCPACMPPRREPRLRPGGDGSPEVACAHAWSCVHAHVPRAPPAAGSAPLHVPVLLHA